MKAVIMAGGKGTRLFPLTNRVPKPMVDFCNRPNLEHLVGRLAACGFEEVYLTLGYRPDLVSGYFGDGSRHGLRMRYSVEVVPLGTAGGVKALEPVLDETFLVVSGDAVCDLDLREPVAFHKAQGADVTLVLTRVDNPMEFGLVVTDENHRVIRFLEKPKSWSEAFTDVVNTGIYVLEPQVLREIPADCFYDFSKHLFPRLLADGAKMCGMLTEAYWCDVGSLVQYRQAHFEALTGRIRGHAGAKEEKMPGVLAQGETRVAASAQVRPPVLLGEGARIAAGAIVGPFVVLGPGARVEERACVVESVILREAVVGRGATVYGCIIAQNTIVAPATSWQHVAADERHLTRVAPRAEAPMPQGFAARHAWRRAAAPSARLAEPSAVEGAVGSEPQAVPTGC